MDLHVYALLKRKYNDLAESVEGLVDKSAELTEEARKTLAEAQDKLDEIKPLLETSKDNVKISEEQIAKVQELLDELEPAVADIEDIIKQALQNVHTGEYESDREYLKGNETLYNGSTYRALEDVTGVLPTVTSKWQLVAQRGVDGKGSVSSVNNILPDEFGNVDLGDLSNEDYVHSLMKDSTTLDSSEYIATSKAVHDIGVSLGNTNKMVLGLNEDLETHSTSIANRVDTGHVKVGMSLKVNDSGVIDVDEEQFPSKKYVEEAIDGTLSSSENYTDSKVSEISSDINLHLKDKTNPHEVSKTQVGLGDVDNIKQMPISGGEFTGITEAHSNTSYTVPQLRNIIISTSEPIEEGWGVGDIWVVYEE